MREAIADLLKQKRRVRGFSVQDVLEKLEERGVIVTNKTLYAWESGYRQPDADTFLLLCEIYGISSIQEITDAEIAASDKPSKAAMQLARDYDTLDTWGKKSTRSHVDAELKRCIEQAKHQMEAAAEIIDITDIIVFRRSRQPASAGTGMFLGPDEFETIYVQDNPLTRRASFGVPVKGDSMEPEYHDGDVLLVERAEDIRIGDIGVFTIDGQGYVKERGQDELISLNPVYEPIPMNESIRCNGRVIGILEPDWIVDK